MIQLQGAGKRFGHKLLFEDCDWLITPKERTGLVGANGTGKSTLLKILCGLESLDYGAITFAKGISQGYLPQDGLSLTGRTVFAECMSVFEDLREMEQEMEILHHKLAELDPAGPEYAAAIFGSSSIAAPPRSIPASRSPRSIAPCGCSRKRASWSATISAMAARAMRRRRRITTTT